MIHSLIFFPEKEFYAKPSDFGLVAKDLTLMNPDHHKLHAWFLEAENPSGKVMLYLHGNAGNISGRLHKAKGWVERGISVLLLDYRSYGQSEGVIKHQSDLVSDAKVARDWLINDQKVSRENFLLYGESLGSYPATMLATEEKYHALILEAPFTSFLDLAKKHYALVPGKETLLKPYRFANIENISNIKVPLFIIHGTEDDICPYEMGQKLFEEAPEPKAFYTVDHAVHNNLPEIAGESYWSKPFDFIQNNDTTKTP